MKKNRKEIPVRFRRAGRVWCGGAREPRVAIGRLLSKWSIFSNLPDFLDLNGSINHFFIAQSDQ